MINIIKTILFFVVSNLVFASNNDLEIIDYYSKAGDTVSNSIYYIIKNKQFEIDVEQDTLTGHKYGNFKVINPLTENDILLIDSLRTAINISDGIIITFNNSNINSIGWANSYEYLNKLQTVKYLSIHCSGNTIIPEFLFRKPLTQLSIYASDTIDFKDVHTNTALISNIYIKSKSPITILKLDNISYKGKIINLDINAAVNNLDEVVNDLIKIGTIEDFCLTYPYKSYQLTGKYPLLPSNIFEINARNIYILKADYIRINRKSKTSPLLRQFIAHDIINLIDCPDWWAYASFLSTPVRIDIADNVDSLFQRKKENLLRQLFNAFWGIYLKE